MSHKLPVDIAELDPSGDIRQIADDAGALNSTGATRRGLLKRGAIGAGGVAAAGTMMGLLSPLEAFAQSGSRRTKGAYSLPGRVNRRAAATLNDVRIGNYALTLEYIEAAFYAAAVQANYPDPALAAAARVLSEHEAAHVSALQETLGRFAVDAPELNLDTVRTLLATQESFIRAAAAVEPVGTAAYAGAGPWISNLGIVKAALAIHSVEANHAAYTAQLCLERGLTTDINGDEVNPVPNILNPAFTFARTIRIVGSLNVTTGTLQPGGRSAPRS